MWLLRRTESWMQESGESSSALQLSSSSGRVAGMTGKAHEVSSSGASSRSKSRQERRNSGCQSSFIGECLFDAALGGCKGSWRCDHGWKYLGS